ncbi:MAG: tRNA preQ1(34) S-adenosylmethionine ribosyltransferase-isomerase QueA [Clostridia bacterium]|nr:tRNA preQ1(34) S-adenosylmethionine ribosyltransferase-isomerase QueA [Clostridia bacterium]
MKTDLFDYYLPEELIAQTPVEPRDSSRLLVYNRKDNQINHKRFYEIIDFLNSGDVLVINNTKVIPARLYGNRQNTNGKVEILLLKRLSITDWEIIIKPGKTARVGTIYSFGDNLKGEIIAIKEDGKRDIRFIYEGVFEDILSQIGQMPLPPYIKEKLANKERYNTVYSKTDGSAAAPTAGLHFTKELLDKIKAKGIQIVEVLLHVGLGTFRPVKVDDIFEHVMHSEYYEVSDDSANAINRAKQEGRRIIAVGTTSVRVLESATGDDGKIKSGSGDTSIFIYPSYKFKMVDALITNFHLPKSTLMMLVSALAGREEILSVYNTAVKEQYRFFSFGDSMFIL